MNTGHDHDEFDDFDAKLSQVHAQAVDHVSPRMLVQLRPQQGASRASASPAKPRLQAWPLAATCAIALAAGGLFLRQPTQNARVESIVTATDNNEPGDVYAALDESPELYVWLASGDTDLVTE